MKKEMINELRISITSQEIYTYSSGLLKKTYPISTSKYGIGNQKDSYKTPLGHHFISEKIGNGAALCTIFKAGKSTGKTAVINCENSADIITTRIMKLTGLEENINKGDNIDSYHREIWIHGTPEEDKIGYPASHGCIRMKNQDICELFDLVENGASVMISE